MHRKPLTRSARRSIRLMVGSVVVGVGLIGCDTPEHQADRQVQSDIDAARTAHMRGDSSARAQAQVALEKAASHAGIAAETRVNAKSGLAQVEQESAVDDIQGIDRDTVAAGQLIDQISELAQQIQQTHAATVAYDKYDPKPAHDAIAASIAAVQGDANKPDWIKNGSTSIPSLSAVKQEISRLEGLIATQHDQQKSLEDRRAQVLNDADAASRSSDASKGQQSVDEFKRASDLRKQSGDLAVQIEKTQADTRPLDAALKVAQGQQSILQDAIKQMQDESDALDAGWKSLTEVLAGQSTLAKQILSTNGNTVPPTGKSDTNAMLFAAAGASLSEKADALSKLQEDLKNRRATVEATLRNSISHYVEAATTAQEIYAKYDTKIKDPNNTTREETIAWTDLQKLYNPANYKLDAATTQRLLASVYASEVFNVAARQRMQQEVAQALTGAGLEIPASLNDAGLDAEKTAAATSAKDAYGTAESTIETLTSGTAPAPIPSIAKVENIFTLYGQLQLARAAGDPGTAKDKLDAAIAARDTAIDSSLTLPILPPELKSAAKPAAPAASAPTPAT